MFTWTVMAGNIINNTAKQDEHGWHFQSFYTCLLTLFVRYVFFSYQLLTPMQLKQYALDKVCGDQPHDRVVGMSRRRAVTVRAAII